MPRVALQLWTIRDECECDLAGALERVRAQGYDGVELFQYHGPDASGAQELPSLAAEAEALGTDRVMITSVDPGLRLGVHNHSSDDVPAGEGVVGYDRILPPAVAAGVEWLIMEEDEVRDDPFGAVERSLPFIKGLS